MTTEFENPYAALEDNSLEQRSKKNNKNRKNKKETSSGESATPANQESTTAVDASAEDENGWTVKEKKKAANPEEKKAGKKSEGGKASGSLQRFARDLEEKAKDKENRTATLTTWVQSLKDSSASGCRDDRTGAELTFRQAFIRSRAMENLVESLVQSWNDASDQTLVELFGSVFDGTAAEHKQLVSHMKALAQAYHGRRPPPMLSKMLVSVVEGFKSEADTHNEEDADDDSSAMERELKKIDAQIAKLEAKLKAGGEDNAAEGGIQLEILQLCEQKRRVVSGGESVRSADDVQHIFSNFTKEVAAELDRIHKQRTDTVKKREHMAAERKTMETKGDSDLVNARASRKAVDTDEEKLRARKAALEKELEEVKASLNGIQRRRDDAERVLKECEANRNKRLATIEDREAVLKGDSQRLDDEQKSFDTIREFVETSHSLLAKLRGNKTTDQGTLAENVVKEYLKAMAAYLNAQVKAVEMLQQRVTFCQKSIDRMQDEKKEMTNSGLMDIAQDITASIAKLKKTQSGMQDQLRAAKKMVEKTTDNITEADKKLPEYKNVSQFLARIDKLCP